MVVALSAIFGFGGAELLLVLLLFLLLFGVESIPRIARSLGRAQANFARIKDDVLAAVEREETGITKEQEEFERMREAQMRAQDVTPVEDPGVEDHTGR